MLKTLQLSLGGAVLKTLLFANFVSFTLFPLCPTPLLQPQVKTRRPLHCLYIHIQPPSFRSSELPTKYVFHPFPSFLNFLYSPFFCFRMWFDLSPGGKKTFLCIALWREDGWKVKCCFGTVHQNGGSRAVIYISSDLLAIFLTTFKTRMNHP